MHVVALASADKATNTAAAETIRKTTGKLDVVIANAAIGDENEDALTIQKETMTKHFEVSGGWLFGERGWRFGMES